MKSANYITIAFIAGIALLFTLIIGKIVPGKQFEPYTIALDSVWQKIAGDQEYLIDLNNDFSPEFLTHHSINQSGHSIEFLQDDNFYTLHIFYENDFFISTFLHFADVNQNLKKEIIFLTAIDKIAYLNIYAYDSASGQYKPNKKVEIGSIKFYNNKPDVINYSLIADQTAIYFDLTPGYSANQRHIYKYNLTNDSISKTDRNSFVIKKTGLINVNGKKFLLAKEMQATCNTMTRHDYESMEKSTNKDTIEMFKIYKPLKHLVYDYGDFSSYILLYSDSLKFAFEPIEFFGWTNYTKSEFININGIPHIIAFTNTDQGDTISKAITLCDLKGNIVKQLPLPHDFTEIYTGKGRIVFKDKENLFVYSDKLEMTKQIPDITNGSGFFDIDGDQDSEFIAFRNNEMIVLSSDFDINATYKISQEFAPYPEESSISLLQMGDRQTFVFNTRLFYYIFSYNQNVLAIFKYPFYFLIFLFWSGLLFLLLKINSKRLEKEKQQLEKIVSERTVELQSKNLELVAQKEEIQSQSEEIAGQYQRLEKLDQFKESLTHALVHDLKNPLSQVLINTKNKNVRTAAGKMLRLITNMLDVEKYEDTGFILNKEIHCLRNILAEVITGQKTSLKEKNIELNLHFTDYKIMVDKEVMIRIFDNLLSNAIRHSPLNRSIEVKAEPSGEDMLHISMKNYGEPIPDDVLPFIFDKYRHFGKTDGGALRSTGLGLTFCKMAVEAHGGIIGARNNPDEGCSFWFTVQHTSQSVEAEETINTAPDLEDKIEFTECDYLIIKQVTKQIKDIKIFEISRFHEVLDPLKETAGANVNEWISLLFSAINIQNIDEYKRLINLSENEQT